VRSVWARNARAAAKPNKPPGAGLIRFCEQRLGPHARKPFNYAPEYISRMGWPCARARPLPDGRHAGLVLVRCILRSRSQRTGSVVEH
jgi:hypothetical protein